MKFIRTKEGRIIDLERYENKTTPILKAKGFITLIDKLKMCDIEVYEKGIIKESDTIEGLCDEFIAIPKQLAEGHIPITFKGAQKFAKNGMVVYGAIWTDKGLIYVAKMNSEGEFKLL